MKPLVSILAVLLVCAAFDARADELKVVVPDDPFIPDAELEALEGDLAALTNDRGEAVHALFAPLLERLHTRVEEIDLEAQWHRKDALELQGRIEAFGHALTAFDEEKARFDATCAAPEAATEARCKEWAQALEAKRAKLRTTREDLGADADALNETLAKKLSPAVAELRGTEVSRVREDIATIRAAVAREATPATAKGDAGTVHGVEGPVFRLGPDGLVPLALDGRIAPGEAIVTGLESRCEIHYGAGTSVRLGAESWFLSEPVELPPEDGTMTTALRRGLVRVTHPRQGGGQERRLRLRCPTCVIAVRGTDVIAEVAPDGGAVVSVIEGAITVTTSDGAQPVDVEAPRRVTVTADGRIAPVTPIAVQAVEQAWRAATGEPAPAKRVEPKGEAEEQPPILDYVLLGAAALFLVVLLLRKRSR